MAAISEDDSTTGAMNIEDPSAFPDDDGDGQQRLSENTSFSNKEDEPEFLLRKILHRTMNAMSFFAFIIVINSVVGLLVVASEWNQVQYTRKLANSLGIALWGLYETGFLVRYHHVKAQEPVQLLGFLRNISWLSLVLSLLTGSLLAVGCISSCGKGWTFYAAFYHIIGAIGIVGSLAVWFALPGLVRCKLLNDGEEVAAASSNRHLRPIRRWVLCVAITGLLVLPYTAFWVILYAYLNAPVDEIIFPERSSSLYRLPFLAGEKVMLVQGGMSRGTLSHSGYYAYDFGAACGTTVVAARGGIVDYVIDSYDGNYLSGQWVNNGIGIYHREDAATAWYLHLQKGSALVQPGDEVVQGQPIAKLGNVGYSSGPHLHFHVYSEFSGSRTPVSFQDITKDKGIPRPLRFYESWNDGWQD